MQKIFFLCLFSLLSPGAFGQRNSYSLKFTPLSENLYTYISYGTYAGERYPANAMYLITEKGVVLFDTPWGKEYYQALLDSIWARHHQKVILCISTHFHDDRTGGLKYYRARGIKTYTTYKTDSLCRTNHNNRAQFLMRADTTFHIGSHTFQTYYPGPGHTLDNIVIWFPEQKVLYGGCFIKSAHDKTLGNLEDADVKDWRYSLHRLQKKFPNPKYIIVGHNDWRNKNSIQHTIDMLSAYKN